MLGEGGLSPEYMKIYDSDDFDPVKRNEGQACKSVEVIEDLSDDYFPRFLIFYIINLLIDELNNFLIKLLRPTASVL